MSPHLRIASMSVASVAAIGLCGATVIAPPALAEPCTGAAAAAQPQAPAAPPAPVAAAPLPTTGGPPVGHRPAYASTRAALPRIGQIPRALLNALTPQGQVQKQAGVAPPPAPPAPPVQQPPDP